MAYIDDFGERLPLARKDLYKSRGIFIDDFDDIPKTEYDELIRRDFIWPAPNYVQLVDEHGVDPVAAYILKLSRNCLPAKPKFGSGTLMAYRPEAVAREFVEVLSNIRALAECATTKEQAMEFLGCLKQMTYRNELQEMDSETGELVLKKILYTFEYTNYRNVQLLINRYNTLENEVRLQNFPYRYIGALVNCRIIQRDGKWVLVDKSRNVLVGKDTDFSSDSELIEYVRRPEFAKELADNKEEKVSRVVQIVRPQLERVERRGPNLRNNINCAPVHFESQFEFRGVQFGNWNNQKDRQACMNYAYDSLVDLAYVLGLPTNFIKLVIKKNGALGVAFGARGHSAAAAHYEPSLHIINLTKMSGAGSLAHELGHAIDYWAADFLEHTDGSSGLKLPCISSLYSSMSSVIGKYRDGCGRFQDALHELAQQLVWTELPVSVEELLDVKHTDAIDAYRIQRSTYRRIAMAMNSLELDKLCGCTVKEIRAMSDKAAVRKEIVGESLIKDRSIYEMALETSKSCLDFTERAVKELENCTVDLSGDFDFGALTRYSDVLSDAVADIEKVLEMTEDSDATFTVGEVYGEYASSRRKSRFLANAEKLDTSRRAAYYSVKTELFARAFEHYVERKLKERGVVSQYLVHSAHNIAAVYFGYPYPDKLESDRICELFDKVFAELRKVGKLKAVLCDHGGDLCFSHNHLYDNKDIWVSYAANVVSRKKVDSDKPVGAAVTLNNPEATLEAPKTKQWDFIGTVQGLAGVQPSTPSETLASQITNVLAKMAVEKFGVRCGYTKDLPKNGEIYNTTDVASVVERKQGLIVHVKVVDTNVRALQSLIFGLATAQWLMETGGDVSRVAAYRLAGYIMCKSAGLPAKTFNITKWAEVATSNQAAAKDLVDKAAKVIKSGLMAAGMEIIARGKAQRR